MKLWDKIKKKISPSRYALGKAEIVEEALEKAHLPTKWWWRLPFIRKLKEYRDKERAKKAAGEVT